MRHGERAPHTFMARATLAGVLALALFAVPGYAPIVPAAEAQVSRPAAEDSSVRPFRANVPEEALADLRRRVAATRWPDRETVTDQSQGIQLAKLQELVRYWGTNTTGARRKRSSMRCHSSSRRSTAWTSTSSTSARAIRTRCR